MAEPQESQTALAVQALRHAVPEACFALKGGTAINLFVRDLPRLSVDIDLIFLPVADREKSLRELDVAMRRIAAAITDSPRPIWARERMPKPGLPVTRLLVSDRDGVRIKVEVSPVLRGCVYPPEDMQLTPRAATAYGPLQAQVLSTAELYAGKLVAALDRQHPRDLFDVHLLLRDGGGLDAHIREAFVVYLISHNRPMHELLSPKWKELPAGTLDELARMSKIPVSPTDLLRAREDLLAGIIGGMPERHRQFLLSFEKGRPDWQLLEVEHASTLPAVRWRMRNLDILPTGRRAELMAGLEEALGGNGHGNGGDGRRNPLEIPDPFRPPSPFD